MRGFAVALILSCLGSTIPRLSQAADRYASFADLQRNEIETRPPPHRDSFRRTPCHSLYRPPKQLRFRSWICRQREFDACLGGGDSGLIQRLQLELSAKLRRELLTDPQRMRGFVGWIRAAYQNTK